jgi:hypothetical protein
MENEKKKKNRKGERMETTKKSISLKGYKLKEIIVDDKNPKFSTINGVLFDKRRKTMLFYPYGRKETEYAIPAGIKRINETVFKNCKNLESVIFPKSLKSIEKGAFENCENLTSITLPAGLKYIRDYAFTGCKRLKKVTLSQKTKIGHRAFDDSSVEFVYLDMVKKNIKEKYPENKQKDLEEEDWNSAIQLLEEIGEYVIEDEDDSKEY